MLCHGWWSTFHVCWIVSLWSGLGNPHRGEECFLVLHMRRQDTEMMTGAPVKVMLTLVTWKVGICDGFLLIDLFFKADNFERNVSPTFGNNWQPFWKWGISLSVTPAIEKHPGHSPGGSVAETSHSQCRGLGFDPWKGTRSHMLQLSVQCHNLRSCMPQLRNGAAAK